MKTLGAWLVLLPSLAFAEPARALIWGGGATRDVADAALKALDASDVRARLTFAAGFPKVVDSASVKGLKPGFQVVLLGVCAEEDDAALALSVAKSVEPKVYARKVELEEKASCPALHADWKLVDSFTEGGLELDVVGDGKTLQLLALLNDEKGEPLDFVTEEAECTVQCDGVKLGREASGASVAFTAVTPGCTTPNEQDYRWLVTQKKKRLSARLIEGKFRRGECD